MYNHSIINQTNSLSFDIKVHFWHIHVKDKALHTEERTQKIPPRKIIKGICSPRSDHSMKKLG